MCSAMCSLLEPKCSRQEQRDILKAHLSLAQELLLGQLLLLLGIGLGVLLDGSASGPHACHLGLVTLGQRANVKGAETTQQSRIHRLLHSEASLRETTAHVHQRCTVVGGPAHTSRLHKHHLHTSLIVHEITSQITTE